MNAVWPVLLSYAAPGGAPCFDPSGPGATGEMKVEYQAPVGLGYLGLSLGFRVWLRVYRVL